jgi:uncharacterized short protein YbdD (DUF466 family)
MSRGSALGGTPFKLSSCLARLRRTARIVWRGLREWCGDAAYERYLCSARSQSGARELLSPAEFYVEQLDRRYSRPNRCC